jgi:hypothetical protein
VSTKKQKEAAGIAASLLRLPSGGALTLDSNDGDGYTPRAQAWLKSVFEGGGPQPPSGAAGALTRGSGWGGTVYRPPTKIAGPQAIEQLQWRLINAGLLDPNNIKTTLSATANLLKLTDAYGFKSEMRTLAELEKGFIGWEAKQERAKFTAPAFQPMAEEDLREAIDTEYQSVIGKLPSPEEQAAVVGDFRGREKARHGQVVSASRAAYDEADSAGMVGDLPNPRSVVSQRLKESGEAQVFHGARLMLDFLDRARSGRI